MDSETEWVIRCLLIFLLYLQMISIFGQLYFIPPAPSDTNTPETIRVGC